MNPDLALFSRWRWRRTGFGASEATRWTSFFRANTWRTLGRIGRPQGRDYTSFLTSAPFPSHPETHDREANKGQAAALSSSGPFRSAPVTSGAGVCLLQLCGRVDARASLRFQSDKAPSGEPERTFLSIPPRPRTRRLLSAPPRT